MIKAVIFSGPRGAGKGALVEGVRKAFPQLTKLVTTTTRPPRAGEQDGVHYHFVDDTTFEKFIDEGHLITHARLGAYQYGPAQREVLRHRTTVTDVSPDIARSIKKFVESRGGAVLMIGVLAPEVLRRERIRNRQKGTPESEIDQLLKDDIVTEDKHEYSYYDLIITNDKDLGSAVAEATDEVRQFLI